MKELVGQDEKVLTSELRENTLREIFDFCLYQQEQGKGQERHNKGKKLMDQPWKRLADTHGYGFLTGQAEKKLQEAQGFKDHELWEKEMIGSIVYSAMAVLHRRMENKDG